MASSLISVRNKISEGLFTPCLPWGGEEEGEEE